MDVGKSIGYVFEDKKWTNKLLIGMLVSIVPIVNFALLGWVIDIMRNVSQRQPTPLPEWSDFGEKFVKGAILFVVVIFSALRSCSRVRKLALKEAGFSGLGKSAVALQTGLVAFLVGGSFVIFQYNEVLWHMIGLTIVLERLAKQRQSNILSDERLSTSVSSIPTKVSNAA